MEERAHRIGGELRIESDPGEGTRVLLSFGAGFHEYEPVSQDRHKSMYAYEASRENEG